MQHLEEYLTRSKHYTGLSCYYDCCCCRALIICIRARLWADILKNLVIALGWFFLAFNGF